MSRPLPHSCRRRHPSTSLDAYSATAPSAARCCRPCLLPKRRSLLPSSCSTHLQSGELLLNALHAGLPPPHRPPLPSRRLPPSRLLPSLTRWSSEQSKRARGKNVATVKKKCCTRGGGGDVAYGEKKMLRMIF